MNSQPISFPQYIDNPNQIGPFEVDDLMPFLMILWVGVFLKTKANAIQNALQVKASLSLTSVFFL